MRSVNRPSEPGGVEKLPHLAEAVANSFLDIAKSDGEAPDPMKLQKLVYFGHGWHLGYGRGALSAECVQAWRWGPVFPGLYRAVKVWGSGPIMKPLIAVEYEGGEFCRTTPRVPPEAAFARKLIGRVWEVYGPMSGPELSQLSHEPGGPWHEVRTRNPGARRLEIPNRIIREHFEQKIRTSAGT